MICIDHQNPLLTSSFYLEIYSKTPHHSPPGFCMIWSLSPLPSFSQTNLTFLTALYLHWLSSVPDTHRPSCLKDMLFLLVALHIPALFQWQLVVLRWGFPSSEPRPLTEAVQSPAYEHKLWSHLPRHNCVTWAHSSSVSSSVKWG